MAKHRYQVTERRIEKLLKEGRGSGYGASYKPWITIHDVSSLGRSTRIKGAKTGRLHHYLSDLETDVHLECDWALEVIDIREQFPLPRSETLLIADAMGVAHPQFQGVKIVMTTDILLDVVCEGRLSLRALSIKYESALQDARTLEKLEIERRYWASREIPWSVVTEKSVSKTKSLNLRWLNEWLWLDGLAIPYDGWWEERCAIVLGDISSKPQAVRLNKYLLTIDHKNGWQLGTAMSAFRHLAANRLIHLDPETFNVSGPTSQVAGQDIQALK